MDHARQAGIVVAGHGVASGRSGDPRFADGTIALQAPLFRARGVDLTALIGAEPVMGTINLDMAPLAPHVIAPEIAIRDLTWSPHMPAESFWLFRAWLTHDGRGHRALLYMPDPATKPDHFQPRSVVEIIGARVAGLRTGDPVEIATDPAFLRFERFTL